MDTAGLLIDMAHKNSRSSRKMFLGMLLFWLTVGAAVAGRITYSDQISAQATSELLERYRQVNW
jgi:uncharacterized membrane protein YhaH (DUF805 family)